MLLIFFSFQHFATRITKHDQILSIVVHHRPTMLTIPHNNIKQIDLIRIGNMPEHELSRKEALLN